MDLEYILFNLYIPRHLKTKIPSLNIQSKIDSDCSVLTSDIIYKIQTLKSKEISRKAHYKSYPGHTRNINSLSQTLCFGKVVLHYYSASKELVNQLNCLGEFSVV